MSKIFIVLIVIISSQQVKSAPIQNEKIYRTILPDQKSAIIEYGKNVELSCYFTTAVTRCAWSREGNLLEITERYAYVKGNGNSTSDCSIQIWDFQKIDAGQWKCESMADSKSTSMISTNVLLQGTTTDISKNLPQIEIVTHEELTKMHNGEPHNQVLVKRSINDVLDNDKPFVYACILEKIAQAELHWEINDAKVDKIENKEIELSNIRYNVIYLSYSKIRENFHRALEEGDMLKCQAKFSDQSIPAVSAEFEIQSDQAQKLTLRGPINYNQEPILDTEMIIIALGVIIGILLVLLIIFSTILIKRHHKQLSETVKEVLSKGKGPEKDSGILAKEWEKELLKNVAM